MDGAGASEFCQLAARNSGDVQGLARLMDTVHKYGTRMFLQLNHPGRNYGLGGEEPVSASAVALPGSSKAPRSESIASVNWTYPPELPPVALHSAVPDRVEPPATGSVLKSLV